MNIFMTDQDPAVAAQSLPDSHVSKMSVETVQMLVSALNRYEIEHNVITQSGTVHRGGYKNHPCTRWAGDTRTNALWLLNHGLALCDEFEHRYEHEHACKAQLLQVQKVIDQIPDGPFTTPHLAMPDEWKVGDDWIESYRNCIYQKVLDRPRYFRWVKDPSRMPGWLYDRMGADRLNHLLKANLATA